MKRLLCIIPLALAGCAPLQNSLTVDYEVTDSSGVKTHHHIKAKGQDAKLGGIKGNLATGAYEGQGFEQSVNPANAAAYYQYLALSQAQGWAALKDLEQRAAQYFSGQGGGAGFVPQVTWVTNYVNVPPLTNVVTVPTNSPAK
jgi:hypothetical protein